MTRRWIDLNADVGEIPAALADGSEEQLLGMITSANIACGGHAGDAQSMQAVVSIARRLRVSIGAHPGYPDRANFGRHEMQLTPEEIERMVASQVRTLFEVARDHGARMKHVKPHGALYNVAVQNVDVARAIASGVRAWRDDVYLVGLAGSRMLEVWRQEGFRVAAEAFADRAYEPDGTLRARRHSDALITNPAAAARQAVEIVENGRVVSIDGTAIPIAAQTLCVHGDTPNVVHILTAIRAELQARDIDVHPMHAD